MSIRRQRGFLKRQADAQRSLLDGSQQGTLRIATPYKVTAGRRGVLAAGGNADAGAHLHLTAQPAVAVAAGAAYDVAWDGQDAAHPAAGYATTALTLPLTAAPVVVAGYYDLQVLARWASALAWSVEIVRTRAAVETVVWPPAVLPETAAFSDRVGAVHVLAVEILAGDTITARLSNDSAAAGTVEAAHLSLSLVDRSRGVVTDPVVPEMFVAAGHDDKVATSPDGVTWTLQTVPLQSSTQLRGVGYGNGLWIICGPTDSVITSPDAVTWTKRTFTSIPGAAWVNSVAYGNGLWIGVGDGSNIIKSTDGITWTQEARPFAQTMHDVRYENGLWMITGDFTVATSPDGTTWTTSAPTGPDWIYAVAYGAGLWVVTGEDFGVATSPDGTTWTERNTPFDGGLGNVARDVSYGNGLFVIVGGYDDIATSPDGITWTARTSAFDSVTSAWGVAYDSIDDVWVMVGSNGKVATSPDGATWTLQTGAFGTSLHRAVTSGPAT